MKERRRAPAAAIRSRFFPGSPRKYSLASPSQPHLVKILSRPYSTSFLRSLGDRLHSGSQNWLAAEFFEILAVIRMKTRNCCYDNTPASRQSLSGQIFYPVMSGWTWLHSAGPRYDREAHCVIGTNSRLLWDLWTSSGSGRGFGSLLPACPNWFTLHWIEWAHNLTSIPPARPSVCWRRGHSRSQSRHHRSAAHQLVISKCPDSFWLLMRSCTSCSLVTNIA